jgi:mono/diheme cytochrome c family protein
MLLWAGAGVAAAGLALALAAAGGPAFAGSPATSAERTETLKRGEYLVAIGGCNDCHTPFKMGPQGPEPDMSRMLSGHPEKLELPPPPAFTETWNFAGNSTNTASAGPWGMSFARNLTPDPETGLGSWTEEQFVRTIRTGKHLGIPSGRPILPPMPWQAYAHMTDEDLKAVWAYLQTVPAIRNEVPQSVPALPGAAPAN